MVRGRRGQQATSVYNRVCGCQLASPPSLCARKRGSRPLWMGFKTVCERAKTVRKENSNQKKKKKKKRETESLPGTEKFAHKGLSFGSFLQISWKFASCLVINNYLLLTIGRNSEWVQDSRTMSAKGLVLSVPQTFWSLPKFPSLIWP